MQKIITEKAKLYIPMRNERKCFGLFNRDFSGKYNEDSVDF